LLNPAQVEISFVKLGELPYSGVVQEKELTVLSCSIRCTPFPSRPKLVIGHPKRFFLSKGENSVFIVIWCGSSSMGVYPDLSVLQSGLPENENLQKERPDIG